MADQCYSSVTVQFYFSKQRIVLASTSGSRGIPSISALLIMPKSLTVWITNCGKFFKRQEYQMRKPDSQEMGIPDVLLEGQEATEPAMKNGLVQLWERSTSRLYIVILLI